MLTKRIIPCLDVKDGRTVKGVNFVNLRDAGDPIELGRAYAAEGADELVFLDITATSDKRKTLVSFVEGVARQLNIPFTVGGGITSVDDALAVLNAGADKVGINSAALLNPDLITQLAKRFGAQCVMVAVDAREEAGKWNVYRSGGRTRTDRELYGWARELEQRGAGELMFTSMNHDGTKTGFANEALARLHDELNIPVIASGGAGNREHFKDAFTQGKADAALAASVFHFGEIKIPELKKYLRTNLIAVR